MKFTREIDKIPGTSFAVSSNRSPSEAPLDRLRPLLRSDERRQRNAAVREPTEPVAEEAPRLRDGRGRMRGRGAGCHHATRGMTSGRGS